MGRRRGRHEEVEDVESEVEEPEDGESTNEGVCELCGRQEFLTAHHLIPRSRHKKARMKRMFKKSEMKTRLAMLCEACHRNVHRCVSEQELGESYNTLELLREHPGVAKFTAWISKKPAGYLPR